MKKILFFMPNIERGGIEKNLIILSNYFEKKNYSIEIVYGQISNIVSKKINKKVKKTKVKKFIDFTYLNPRIVNTINCFFYLLFFYSFRKEEKILSFQDHPIAIFISLLKKLKCIIRIANHPVGSLKFYNSKIIFIIKLYIKNFSYLFSDGIICNSMASTNYFKKKFKSKKIITIYNPIQIKKDMKNKIRNNQIISVGRLQNQKNFHGLIKAFNLIKDNFKETNLIIIGSGSYLKSLKKLSKNLNLSKRVIFYKYQNPSNFIKKSKIFILNSLWEGLPNILIETQNYLTPIISTNCLSGPDEILKNGKYGYLVPINNEIKLANKIKYVLSNYKEAKQKSKLAFEDLGRFDISNQCKKYDNFLKQF